MTATARPNSQVLILCSTVLFSLVAGICVRIAETARLEPNRFRPEGVFQFSVLVLAVIAAASAGTLVGRRLFSRPTAALLGAVGGGLAATLVNPVLGALGGFVVGLVVSLDLGRRALSMAIVFVLGALGVGLARRIFLDAGAAWFWASAVVFLMSISIQILVCRIPVGNRIVAAERRRGRWQATVSTSVLVLVALLTLVSSWIGGWYGETYLRIRGVEQRGGFVSVFWGSTASIGRRWGLSAATVALHNPTHRDWVAVGGLTSVFALNISGDETDDEALAEMPPLPGAWRLFIANSEITGSFLATRKLPNLSSIYVTNSPFDDEAMTHLGQLRGLTEMTLAETKVTGRGLARLSGLTALGRLTISEERIRDEDLRWLAGLSVTRLYLNCPNITSDGWQHLNGMQGLANLVIVHPIDERALRDLQGLPTLRTLDVRLLEIEPATVAALKRFQPRVRLSIAVPGEYRPELQSLEKQLPQTRVFTYEP